jgi:hypothetical protein
MFLKIINVNKHISLIGLDLSWSLKQNFSMKLITKDTTNKQDIKIENIFKCSMLQRKNSCKAGIGASAGGLNHLNCF